MKKIKLIIYGLVLLLVAASCDLTDVENYDYKKESEAYRNLTDVRNGMNAAYNYLGSYEFLGNYATILGDMLAGVSNGNASTGHFYAYSTFTFSDTGEEISDMWDYGFKVVNAATRTIQAAQKLQADSAVLESELPQLSNYVGQCHALKALAYYYMVNLYALPYSSANASTPGLPVVGNEPVEAFATIKRATVQETYDQILKDIAAAEEAFAAAGKEAESSAYYMGPMGLQALEARVYMSLGQYGKAEAAAKAAIELKGGDATGTGTDGVPSNKDYLAMWGSTAISGEDLFTIVKSSDDNLSANSLNTAYNSYYCTLQKAAYDFVGERDVRRQLLKSGGSGGITTTKYDGIPSEASVSNIPVFRKSEMSLIVAEVEARNGNIAAAQNYLLFTAKRDSAITSAQQLPSTSEGLMKFIGEERIREFLGEGHRFYDARRMGDIVSGDKFQNWDISKFVLPIPSDEVNAGFGVEQNEHWADNFPE